MEDEREGSLPAFILEDRHHVVIGAARMDHQGQAGFSCRCDVGAESLRLRRSRRLVVVVVEPGFADGHDLRMRREPDECGGRHVELFGSVVRMRADRAKNRVMRLGDLQHACKALHARRDGHHAPDTRSHGARDHGVALFGEVGKVQMAVTVDEQASVLVGSSEGAVSCCDHIRLAVDDVQSGSREHFHKAGLRSARLGERIGMHLDDREMAARQHAGILFHEVPLGSFYIADQVERVDGMVVSTCRSVVAGTRWFPARRAAQAGFQGRHRSPGTRRLLGAISDGGADGNDGAPAGRPPRRCAAKLDKRRVRLDDNMGRVPPQPRADEPLKMPNAPPSSTTVRSPSSHFAASRRSGPS